jgi:hypothetical protein
MVVILCKVRSRKAVEDTGNEVLDGEPGTLKVMCGHKRQ